MADQKPPKVFISYAWEDDVKKWVRAFARRLRNDGVEAIIDEWAAVPGDQLPQFMEKAVRESDFVVIICTPKYKKKSDERQGGVGYEGHIITSEIFQKNNDRKFIPVLRKGSWGSALPSWAAGKLSMDLSGDPYSPKNYQELLRALHGRWYLPPPIGKPPEFPDGEDDIEESKPLANFFTTIKDNLSEFFDNTKLILFKAIPVLRIAGIIAVVITLFWVGLWAIPTFVLPKATSTPTSSVTETGTSSSLISCEYSVRQGETLSKITKELRTDSAHVTCKAGTAGCTNLFVNVGIVQPGMVLFFSDIGLERCASAGGIVLTPTPTWAISSLYTQTIQITPTVSLTPDVLLPSETPQPSATSTESFTPTVLSQVYDPHPAADDYHDAFGVPMRLVSAGNFTMGSNGQDVGQQINQPVQQVYLDNYYIDKYEVTNALYKQCVDSSNCQTPKIPNGGANYYNNPADLNYPVIYVDWYMASAFCKWRNAHLPTEAEWEKAASDSYILSWIDHMVEVGSSNDISTYGVYDTMYSVTEWTSSLYKPYPFNATDGREDPNASGARVLRGGNFTKNPYPYYVFATNRYSNLPTYVEYYAGFRCARDANP